MLPRRLSRVITEYPCVCRHASQERWLAPLLAAHMTPCTQAEASQLLGELQLPPSLRLMWKAGKARGQARYSRRRRQQYGISLPTLPGLDFGNLRIGLVLHEAAHIYSHRVEKHFGHGPAFCSAFHHLIISTDWRPSMTRSFRAIFDRHRGPFSIMLTTEVEKGNKLVQESGLLEGPFSAEEAHEEARTLVNSTKGERVLQAFVWSNTEGSFIGAFYERGTIYKPWHEEESEDGRMELSTQQQSTPAALLQELPEPLQPVGSVQHVDEPKRAVPDDRPVRDVPSEASKPRQPRTSCRIGLNPEKLAAWPPKSEGARLVRTALEELGPIATRDLIERITPECAKAGVAFPGSLVSRLKQSGLLQEVAA